MRIRKKVVKNLKYYGSALVAPQDKSRSSVSPLLLQVACYVFSY
jgi:hypothetical protein